MKAVVIVAAALALAACSTTPGNQTAPTASPSSVEKEYRTGSRIPVRDPAQSSASPVTTTSPSVLAPGTPKAN
ncbi:MAG: hypothetical protein IT522_14390 [Burkholderiales bacterium]|nr:hypothetical protein [Burkholderiales bacterium]